MGLEKAIYWAFLSVPPEERSWPLYTHIELQGLEVAKGWLSHDEEGDIRKNGWEDLKGKFLFCVAARL